MTAARESLITWQLFSSPIYKPTFIQGSLLATSGATLLTHHPHRSQAASVPVIRTNNIMRTFPSSSRAASLLLSALCLALALAAAKAQVINVAASISGPQVGCRLLS